MTHMRLEVTKRNMIASIVRGIPATFIKDNKMELLLKKGKKTDISKYGIKKVRTVGTMR